MTTDKDRVASLEIAGVCVVSSHVVAFDIVHVSVVPLPADLRVITAVFEAPCAALDLQ
jgi:hypothetical protein